MNSSGETREPEQNPADISLADRPVESDVGPLSGVFPLLTIAMGVAACLWGAIGLVVEGNPAPTSALAMVGAGICFIASGVLMLRTHGLLLPAITGGCGILLGVVSQTML